MNTAQSLVSNHLRSGRPVRVAAMLIALLSMTMPAFAQLSRIGANPLLIVATIRGNDSAYDPVNRVYLNVGAHGALLGVFSNTSGDPLSSLRINSTAGFPQFPRVTYSPHVSNGAGGFGGFLVTWHEEQGSSNFVNIRVVAYPDRLVTAQRVVSSPATWWESGPSVAYSPASQVFMIAFRTIDYRIWGARVGTSGEVLNSFQVSQAGFTGRDPSIAWNSGTNQFGVVYSGFNNSGASTGVTVLDAAGNALRHNIFNAAPGTYITDLAYNSATGRYVAVWSQGGTYGAEISGAGDVLGLGLVSSAVGRYDGLGLAYNPVSGTFLMVGHGSTADVWGAELNARGARTSAEQPLTAAGGSGAFYPRPTARVDAPQWNASFGHTFTALRNQVVATSSSGGGPAGSLGGAVVTPTTPTTGSCPGTAPFPGAVCVNGGWVPGTTSGGSTSTGGCPGTTPFPGAVCVNGGWVPGTTSGGSTSTGGCPGTTPFPGAVCVNGGWVPGTTSGGSTSTGGCPGTTPFPGAVCVNGGWVPGTTSGGSTSTGGCPGTTPFPGAVCVNGGWIPGTTSGGSTSTGGCPGTTPFPGAVCVNGGWVPGTGGSASAGGCTTPDPFAAMGGGTCANGGWRPGVAAPSTGSCPGTTPFAGAVCVNGGWIPGTGGSSSTGGCTTPDPFAAIGGGTCANGGWTPGRVSTSVTGSCPGTTPFPGAVCVNGGWVPGTSGSTSSCTTVSPGAGWVCVNGGWLPSSMVSADSGGCTTSDPFTAMGGGVCINGGWRPRSSF